MKIVYVSGPYSPGNGRSIDDNIAIARKHAIMIWERGDVALCPHLNTAHFEKDCAAGYDTYIDGDCEMVSRCDAIYMLPNWEQSAGARAEKNVAFINSVEIEYAHGAKTHL